MTTPKEAVCPREATAEMIAAAIARPIDSPLYDYAAIWQYMFDARPSPEASGGDLCDSGLIEIGANLDQSGRVEIRPGDPLWLRVSDATRAKLEAAADHLDLCATIQMAVGRPESEGNAAIHRNHAAGLREALAALRPTAPVTTSNGEEG